MNAEYTSLAHLARQAQVYEHMPLPIQRALRRSVWISLVTQITSILFITLIPSEWLLRGVSGNGVFFHPIDKFINAILQFSYELSPYLLAINGISLVLTCLILAYSLFMTKPVQEPIHWLAALQSLPTGATIIVTVIELGLLVALIIVTAVVWLVLMIIIFTVLNSALGSDNRPNGRQR
jgi:hypothetical protein